MKYMDAKNKQQSVQKELIPPPGGTNNNGKTQPRKWIKKSDIEIS